MGQFEFSFIPERRIYRISEISRLVREKLEAQFPDLWVEGEISNFRPAASGILYFTLKDQTAQLRCICFRQQARYLRFRPEDGLQVLARGKISVYEARGEYQLIVEHLEPQGRGALQLAFEQLKNKLAMEGLFDAGRKKPLPRLPRRIGIITSPRGAAIQDIIRILRRRFENLHLLIYPVRVQGDGAAQEMVEALRYFQRPDAHGRTVDVLILARGGGSLEDLWAFNEEPLARAIAACPIPVVSAVGHETDITIADFVADLRAPTPSAAAEIVVETKRQLQQQITVFQESLERAARYGLLRLRHQLAELTTHRGFQTLRTMLAQAEQRNDEATGRLVEVMRAELRQSRRRWESQHSFLLHLDLRGKLERDWLRLNRQSAALVHHIRMILTRRRRRLEPLAAQLPALSPRNILERGYAIVFDAGGKVLKDAANVSPGDSVSLQVARGSLTAVVGEVKPE